ncbi:MAG: DNA topoisomerase IB [Gemmataceae bacterium]
MNDPNRDHARAAGLRYTTDDAPGLYRVRRGKGFSYRHPTHEPVRDADTLKRIRSLALPPAWRDVWVCSRPDGHLQATGRDVKGRKQYRYHPRWRETRDTSKFGRMVAFGRALPRVRERVEADLGLPGLPRDKVLATVVRLLELTLIRVGNEEYARENRTYGLTTLLARHASVTGAAIRFAFRGKSGVRHAIDLKDPRLARIVRRCQDLPGQELFRYLDDAGEARAVDSADVNAYLRDAAGDDFTAKDFRTWAGTVLAACSLRDLGPCDTDADTKRNVVRAVEAVAARLGNTPAVCRKSYVHPEVLTRYAEGRLLDDLGRRDDEAAVLAVLDGSPCRTGAAG